MLFRKFDTRSTLGLAIVLFACLTTAVILKWRLLPEFPSTDSSNPVAESKSNHFSKTDLVPADEQKRVEVIENYGKFPLHFEPNKGQIESDEIKFTSRGDAYNLFLSPTNAKLVLSRPAPAEEKDSLKDNLNQRNIKLEQDSVAQTRGQSVIEMNLIGANPQSEAKAVEELEGKSNYFIGNDQSKWKTNVANYKKVRFEEVYSGIDIEYYGNQRELEYDFIVAPNADPKQIKLEFDGVENITVNEEAELVLETAQGEQIKQKKPFIYQMQESGEKTEVKGSYKIETGKEVSFEIGEYDKSKQLIIDPIMLVYSSKLTHISTERNRIAIDNNGNAYLIGKLTRNGSFDIFVTKINSSGTAEVYSIYFGGSGNEDNRGITVDSAGNAYIVGTTCSDNFPTQNAFQSTHAGFCDAFITKINSSGSALVYSTYLGGSSIDEGSGIAVDSDGNAYIAGSTFSSNFPLEKPMQSKSHGDNEAIVAKINASGNALIYSTYLGGSDSDTSNGIAVDTAGNVYVTGNTSSENFPLKNETQNGFGGFIDAFITKINSSGSALIYSTYLGGRDYEVGFAIAVDSAGNTYVTGETYSADFPVSNAIQSRSGGGVDAFVTKLNESGSIYIYSTYLGGANVDQGLSITTDNNGYAYITGRTYSSDFPVINAFQPIYNQGSGDGFVTKLNPSGKVFTFSTYFGGIGEDRGAGIARSNDEFIYLTGKSSVESIDFPITDNSITGGGDAFVSKLSIPTNSISGRVVTSSSQPLSGVQLNSSGDTFNKTITDNSGEYVIELIEGNNHTFAPSFSTHRFSPPAYTFSPLTANQSNVNFTATLINDNFSDAVPLSGASGTVVGNNQDATRQSGEPNHAGQSGNKSVWYRIRSQTTGQAAISTYGSSFDTTLAVYTGTGLNNLSEVAKSDDAASSDLTSYVTFGVAAGTDYWIAVDGKQAGQAGNFKLNYFTTSVTVSGIVTKQGIPQPNLTVRATSTDNNTVAYTTTQSNGSYSLTIPAGSYNFAVLQGTVQQGQAVTVLDVSADRTLNIEIEPSNSSEFIGQGSIRLPVNAIINGLQVTAEAPDGSGSLQCSLQDSATRFVCLGLLPGASYLIKIMSPNYEFAPNDIPLNDVRSNYLDLKFEATHRLIGRIVNGNNRVSGAIVSVTGNTPQGLSINTTTNAAGEYIVRVPTGYNYTVTPSLTGLVFNPVKSDFTNLSNHDRADFSGANICTEQSYSVSPTPSISVTAEGTDSLTLNLSTANNCSWTASTNEQWITVNPSNQSGTGSRAVSFFVFPNPALVSRTATITLAGKSVTVVQEAASVSNGSVRFDFDGDRRADIGVFRPENGAWYIQQSGSGFIGVGFGISTDLITPADFDADGKTDVAVFRPETGSWYRLNSSTGEFYGIQFGAAEDIPLPADFDGDAKADINVFRPSTGSWYRLNSTTGEFYGIQFGQMGDIPLVADFDGDAKSDIAVFRPSAGSFYWLRSTDNQFQAVQFGIETDKPVPADFDGDGKTDIAVYRPENGAWYRLNSTTGEFVGFQFGISTDKPVPADYDGDSKADIAVYREGIWYLQQSTSGFAGIGFGIATDKPVPNSFIP